MQAQKGLVLMAVHSDYVHDHRVRRETSALTDAGFTVNVVAAAPQIKQITIETHDGATVHFIPLKKPGGKARYLEFVRVVREKICELPKPGFCHAHDLDGLLSLAKFAVKQNAKLIYDSHELHTEVHSLQNRPFTRWIWVRIESRYIRKANAVITVSDGIADVLYQRYQLKTRPQVVRNFTDPLHVDFNPDAGQSSLDLPDTPKLALYQGVIQHGRGIDAMLRAIARTRDWGFVICGDGSQKAAMEELAQTLNIADRVWFTGMISREKILQISRFCHAGFLLTEPLGLSHYYSLPNKLTEYIHYGLPVVATGLPEIKHIVEKYQVGRLISPEHYDADEIARALEEVANYKSSFKQRFSEASKDLTWEAEKVQLLNLYNKLA